MSTSLSTFIKPFNGSNVTTIMFKGAPYWIGRDVGAVMGYGADGKGLIDMIGREWADEFADGKEILILKGEDLRAFKSALGDQKAQEVGVYYSPTLLLLSESGIYKAAILSRKPEGRRLRDWLAAEVMPEITRTGFYGSEQIGQMLEQERATNAQLRSENADLRRQLAARSAPPSLRPTDIAAAWARAHLEQGKEPMLLRDAWARYVEWSQEQGLPMPLHLSTLSYGLAALFHQSKTRGAVAYYCQLRAQPLPVDLPQRAQQSLPLPAAEPDAADLADRTLRLLARGDLPAFGVAEILGIKEYEAAAVLGPLVEAGAIHGKARGGRMFYAVDFKRGADLRDRVAHAIGDKPETTMTEVAQALGLDPASRAVQMQIGLAMRDLGYVRHRSGAAGRPYVYRKGEAN